MKAPDLDFDIRLAEEITSTGRVAAPDLARAKAALGQGDRLDRVLLRLGLCEEQALVQAACNVLNLPFLTASLDVQLDTELIDVLTPAFCASRLVAPIRQDGQTALLALADPADAQLVTELRFFLETDFTLAGATASTIRHFLSDAAPDKDRLGAAAEETRLRDESQLRRSQTEGPVIRYVQDLMSDAVSMGASDIHIEDTETGISIRYRINGILQERPADSLIAPEAIIARLKVMAGANVAERRLPQDGRIDTLINGRKIDFRFSSLPTQWGESIVCRILDPKSLRLGWDRLGMPETVVSGLKKLLSSPSGLILVTGPTGSGKTTTLYTAIASLNQPKRKIITVEDPVEYNLDGVQQVQIHEEIGLTFPRVLRSILRHDPNIILVGEIRDGETAEIAIRAAQVGRLVLSTLHTNSAKGAVNRLIDLGVPEYLVRDVLRGVLAQELIIRPCGHCGGAGCQTCHQTGVGARNLVAELWLPGGAE